MRVTWAFVVVCMCVANHADAQSLEQQYEAARFAERYQQERAAAERKSKLWYALGGLALVLIVSVKVVLQRNREEDEDEEPVLRDGELGVGVETTEAEAPENDDVRPPENDDVRPPENDDVRPMEPCPHCGASNAVTWKICDECNEPI